MFSVDPGDSSPLAGLIKDSMSIFVIRGLVPEVLALLAAGGLDVADGKDALVCLAEVGIEGFVVVQASDEVVDLVKGSSRLVAVPEDHVEEVDWLPGSHASPGGGAGEGQGGQDGCEDGGGLHVDFERGLVLGQDVKGVSCRGMGE